MELGASYVNLRHAHAVGRRSGHHSKRTLECRDFNLVRRVQSVAATSVRLKRVAVHEVSILSARLPVLDDLHLDLQLVRVAESLGVPLDMPDQVEAVFHIVATYQPALERNYRILFILGDVYFDDLVVV